MHRWVTHLPNSWPKYGSIEIRATARVGGELIHGREVSSFKVGMLVENMILSHSRAKPAEDIPHCNSQPADTRLAAAFPRLYRDPVGARRRHLRSLTTNSMPLAVAFNQEPAAAVSNPRSDRSEERPPGDSPSRKILISLKINNFPKPRHTIPQHLIHNRAENANPTPDRSLPRQRRQFPRTRHPLRPAKVLPQQPPPLPVRKKYPGFAVCPIPTRLRDRRDPRIHRKRTRQPMPSPALRQSRTRPVKAGRPRRARGAHADRAPRNPRHGRGNRPPAPHPSRGDRGLTPSAHIPPPGRRNRNHARLLPLRRGCPPPTEPGA
jgi:hypothetical protein